MPSPKKRPYHILSKPENKAKLSIPRLSSLTFGRWRRKIGYEILGYYINDIQKDVVKNHGLDVSKDVSSGMEVAQLGECLLA